MKAFISTILFIGISFSAIAQGKNAVQLSGRVTDAQSGQPLVGAFVTLVEVRITTVTDADGKYSFSKLPEGHATLEISFYGYKTLVEHLELSGVTTRDFVMEPTILVNEGVTITAVGNATSLRKAPIPISRVSKTDLLLAPSTNIVDALTREPGVSQVSTGPAISKPMIRGLGFNRLVVINDGIRQEGQQWGEEHGVEIDENSVSRVEIVKGPASLMYGSDAMAGVINIITTSPPPNNTFRANVLTSYATNNKQRSLYGSIGGNHNGFNWTAWGDAKAAADYRNKYDGPVYNSKFREGNYGGYVGYNGSWGFSHFIMSRFHQKAGIIEGARDDEGYFLKSVAGGAEVRATEDDFNSTLPEVPYQDIQHLKLTSENSIRIGEGRLSLNLGWQSNQRREFGNADAPNTEDLHFDLKTFNYNAVYHFDDRSGWATSAGVNGMQQQNSNRADEVLIPEYNLFDVGGFVYTQKTFGKATVSGGLRYDVRNLHANEYFEGSDMKFANIQRNFYNGSGSAGVSYAASEGLLLKLNLARGFRAPGIPELASNGAHEGTNRYEYGNRNLKSEVSWQGDAGLEWNSDHVLFSATAFYNHIDNFIFYNKLSAAAGGDSLVSVNGDLIPAFIFSQQTAKLAGAEFLLDIHPHPLDWFHWENKFSFVNGRFAQAIEGNNNVPFIPAARWLSEWRAELLSKGKTLRNLELHLEMDRTFAQNRAFTAFDTETPTPAYTLFNASLNTQVVRKDKTLFSIYLIGQNLGDVAYQSHLSRLKYTDVNPATGRQGVFNMGRNFMVRIHVPLNFSAQ